jgi:hypothetical protein
MPSLVKLYGAWARNHKVYNVSWSQRFLPVYVFGCADKLFVLKRKFEYLSHFDIFVLILMKTREIAVIKKLEIFYSKRAMDNIGTCMLHDDREQPIAIGL